MRLGLVAVVVARVVTRGRVFAGLFEGVFGGGVVVGIAAEVAFVIVHLNIILLLRARDNAKSKEMTQTMNGRKTVGKECEDLCGCVVMFMNKVRVDCDCF